MPHPESYRDGVSRRRVVSDPRNGAKPLFRNGAEQGHSRPTMTGSNFQSRLSLIVKLTTTQKSPYCPPHAYEVCLSSNGFMLFVLIDGE
jgi:hypothetical protein